MYNLLKPAPGTATGLPVGVKEPKASSSRPKQARKIRSLLKSQEDSGTGRGSSTQLSDSLTAQQNERLLAQLATSMESPKRPANAFMMFCDQYKQSIHNEYMRVCS